MINKQDAIIFLGILIVALCARVLFLSYIPQVVFDEVHFGKFISSYCCTHQRFFDIHPPVGKLIIAAGAYLSGYNGLFSFEFIGQPFAGVPIAGIRLVPALFGVLLSGVIYSLLRLIGVSRQFAALGGIAIALDNALIAESRFVLMDNILLVMTFGALAAGIASVKKEFQKFSWWFIMLAGVLAGASMGIKFTGALAGGLVVLVFLVEMFKSFLPLAKGEAEGVLLSRRTSPDPSFVRRGNVGIWLLKIFVFACTALVIYLAAWALHFSLLTLPGSGDVWGIPAGNFMQDLISVHQQMISANYNLTAGHPYGSAWWTWPFMVRPIFYWQGTTGNQFVYLLGNPAVWWGSLFFFSMALIALCVSLLYKHTRSIGSGTYGFIWIMVIGYLWAYVPLMRVPRVLFLYHYLTPLIFSIIIAIWWVDRMVARRTKFFVVAALCIVAGFVYVSPLTYGYPLPQFWQSALFSIPTWR